MHVDDIILTRDYGEEMINMKKFLFKEFEIKDFEILKIFLSNGNNLIKKGNFSSQHEYTLNLLKEMGMLKCKSTDIPMDPIKKLGMKEGSFPVDKD